MKAKPIASVLCYNVETEKLGRLEEITAKSRIRLKKIDSSNESDYYLTIGEAVGLLPKVEKKSGDYLFFDEMLVIYNLGNSGLDKLLGDLRAADLKIPYKAILTNTNMNWLPKDLIVELKKEHEEMSK